jgi:Domain of unknown function (DUF4342)
MYEWPDYRRTCRSGVAYLKYMNAQTCWQKINAQGAELLEKLKQIVHEGNVRRVVVKQGTRTIAEFPLSAGVVGAVFAPVLAAIGTLVAVLNDCSIEVEREVDPSKS